jgi:hypothetical protein
MSDCVAENDFTPLIERPSTDGQQTRWESLSLALFSFLPFMAAMIYKCLILPRPLWAHFFDPEMIYYVTGRELLHGQPVQNVDNPGTPVQVLSAMILWIFGSEPQTVDQFRLVGYGVAWLLMLLSGFLLVRTLLAPLPKMLQVVALWAWFLCPVALEYSAVWSPEILYFPAASLALATAAKAFRQDSLKSCLCAGMSVGLCCAIKFTFLAWVPPLLLLMLIDHQEVTPKTRRALRSGVALLGITVGFLLATLPVYDRYGQMFSWLWRLATRSGAYGSDAPDSPSLIVLFMNLLRTFKAQWAWSLWLGCCAFAVWGGIRGTSSNLEARKPLLRLAAFALLAMLLNYGMTIRSPAQRYLLPSGLCTIALFGCGAQFSPWSQRKLHQFLLLFGMFLLISRAIWLDIAQHHQLIDRSRARQQAIAKKLRELTSGWNREPCVVYTFPAPMPSLALRVMSIDSTWNEAVGAVYPHEGHQRFSGQVDLTGTLCQSWDFCVVNGAAHGRAKARTDALASELGPVAAEVDGFTIYRARPHAGPVSSE